MMMKLRHSKSPTVPGTSFREMDLARYTTHCNNIQNLIAAGMHIDHSGDRQRRTDEAIQKYLEITQAETY